nr:cardiolipin synthase [uncultured Allomuricauda sp.]
MTFNFVRIMVVNWYSLFQIFYVLITVYTILVIIYYGRRPTKSISWVLAVIVLPFAGPILFYLFGVNRRKFKFFSHKQTAKRKAFKQDASKEMNAFRINFDNNIQYQKISSLVSNSSYTSVLGENQVDVLHDGEATFGDLFKALESAKDFIHIQYYSIEPGKLLDRLFDVFKKKIEQGVKILVLYDSFGSYRFRGKLKKKFESIGVMTLPVMPIRFGNLLFSLNFRNHRKIVVVDGKVAFTGGVNISDNYIDSDTELGRWKDAHLQLHGPIVHDIHLILLKDYFFASSKDSFDPTRFMRDPKPMGNVKAQVVAGGPDSEQPVIMQQYIAMIGGAKKYIHIVNPYFLPGQPFLEALKIAVQSKIEVKLLIPEKSDSLAARYAMFSQFEDLLAVGVRIFLRKDFSHSKIMLVDGTMASVGSGNFDNRSFEHNYETNVLIYDNTISINLSKEFESLCEQSQELKLDTFLKRPKWEKFLEGISKFFKPLL